MNFVFVQAKTSGKLLIFTVQMPVLPGKEAAISNAVESVRQQLQRVAQGDLNQCINADYGGIDGQLNMESHFEITPSTALTAPTTLTVKSRNNLPRQSSKKLALPEPQDCRRF